MKEKFEGPEGQRRLRDVLSNQLTLGNRPELIEQVVKAAELLEFDAGQDLCTQGASDTDVYFILHGAGVQILVDDFPIGAREPGQIVGEMAAIELSATRSATARASGKTVVARISQSTFDDLCHSAPYTVLRGVGRILANRLRERGKFIRPRAAVPKLFIGSSKEKLPVAKALQEKLASTELHVQMWTDSVFKASSTTIEDLEKAHVVFDFAVFVMSPDDVLNLRGETWSATRDNVVFEIGLFMGALGRDRVFGAVPTGAKMRRPSDLFGVNLVDYDPDRDPLDVTEACEEILKRVREKKAR